MIESDLAGRKNIKVRVVVSGMRSEKDWSRRATTASGREENEKARAGWRKGSDISI